jgi:hypothetical protein
MARPEGRKRSVSVAIAAVIIGALLGGVVQAIFAARDRKREARAAALIVGDALTDALILNHGSQATPFRPVFIDYAAYGAVWETERKALAPMIARADYQLVSKAFSALRVLGKKDTKGYDLSNDVFDALYDAAMACEMARRALHSYSLTRREKLLNIARERLVKVKQRREYARMGREAVRARKAKANA